MTQVRRAPWRFLQHVDELNEILPGKKYGWPFVYEDGKFNPQDEPLRVTQQDWAAQSKAPVSGYAPHAAAMQMRFVPRGLWSDSADLDARLVESQAGERLRSRSRAVQPDGYLARPVGIAVTNDGSVLVGDDSHNVIYRLTSGAVPASLTQQKLAKEILVPTTAPTMVVTSRSFVMNGAIPLEHSDYGEGRSPALSWSGAPQGTQSIVLMVEDPQATSPLPFVHWLAVIPAWVRQLPEGIPPIARLPALPNAQQGSNSRTETGYFGPRPPAGDPPHPYHFQVFALAVPLSLPAGFNRHALIEAMRGHVLAHGEIVGTFAKAP